jgi:hypothetical protein
MLSLYLQRCRNKETKLKKITVITFLSILAFVLTACGASAGSSQSNSSSPTEISSSGSSSDTGSSSDSSNPASVNGTPATGPSALQLAAGMLKLDGTSNAVTAQQATQLLPLWQSLQQIESTPVAQGTPEDSGTPGGRFDPAMMQQMSAQIVLIQNAMTPAQIQAITAMNLSMQDISTAFQQAGITMTGPGQGGGFRQNGGTFTPPQGTPRAPGTPGGFQGNGGRRGFGNFLPQSVVNGIVQYLQKKAAS